MTHRVSNLLDTRQRAWHVSHMKIIFTIGLAALATACGSSDDAETKGPDDLEDAAPVIAQYADLVHASYAEAITGATALNTSLAALVATPSQATLDGARSAWLASRPAYLHTEAFRFYAGPIDDEDGPEGAINAWPMDEAYVDYVEGNATAGIINDAAGHPVIDAPSLLALNEQGGETNIATGYHAIEFLLWGQDLSDTGPGARPFGDYVSGGSATNADRRGTYLTVVGAQLVTDLTSVDSEWASGGAYGTAFRSAAARDALGRILLGIGSLSGGELRGERMRVAYDTKSQEDEHSCFSDNTHNDHLHDEIGIENVYLGIVGGVDGPGLDDLVASRDADLDARVKAAIAAAKAAIDAIPQPFDQAILGDDSAPGRVAIKAALDALQVQTDLFVEVAQLLDVPLNLE